MKTGDSASTIRVFDTEAIAGYEALSGAPSATGGVPEPLIGGLFSYLLGAELPGYGTNYLKQTLDFVGTAEVGMPLTASVTITRIRPEKDLVDLATLCRDADGRTICEGRALVLVKDVGHRVSGTAESAQQQ
ncbi:hypothetical protein ACFOW6_17405 [Fodinicurvata halophila]|uniref:Phosphate acetyltransferase n=1 Tax=Fodinicurvata halophila TaxID=1419723 RepID=A0ABV8US33_9PROT